MADVPTEAEVLAASAHEAGRAEAAADNAADDAREAALTAEEAASSAGAVMEAAADDIAERTAIAVAEIIGPIVEGLTTRMDRIEAAMVTVAVEADAALDTAEEALDIADEPPVENLPVAAEDTGLVVATDEVIREPAPERHRKYRRL